MFEQPVRTNTLFAQSIQSAETHTACLDSITPVIGVESPFLAFSRHQDPEGHCVRYFDHEGVLVES
jgi:hypothetical protein